ncbi:MAG: hypothetical protein AAGA66_15635 [Bacteroidota bacterium]
METVKAIESIIPERVATTYGDKAYYAIKACTYELMQCLKDLMVELEERDVLKARAHLHKMLGPCRIMGNAIIEELVTKIQGKVKEDKDYAYPKYEIRKMELELNRLLDGLATERKHVNMLIYSEKINFLAKFIEELSNWDYANSVIQTQEMDQLEKLVSTQLPDVVIVVGRYHSNEFWELIKDIKHKYLGTSLLFYDFRKELFSEPYIQKMRDTIKVSVN